jgi:two-component system, NarL family, response regulator LiaR
MDPLIRILIVDDHVVVRQGLKSMLVSRHGMEVVGAAANGIEALAMYRELQPDVTLMDMEMPGKKGPQVIAEIKAIDRQARILVLTSFGEEEKIAAAIKAGALGYLLKDSSTDDLLTAIRTVYEGNLLLSQPLVAKMVTGLQDNQPPPVDLALTQRELDVLKGIAAGCSNQEIAVDLSVGVNTVRTHVSNILSKLGLENRTQAALYALEHKLN